ncbi:MAG TPA: hypothetical protein VM537_29700, partial [Anaerolineae bacterium]|nr:hypothetical protein [Anaerolineae bacterium]
AKLAVEGEHLLPVQGLACPRCVPGDRETLASFPAVRLFVSSALRIRPGLEVKDADLVHVARICHLLEGLPLAILLAASWSVMLTPAEIVAELEGGGPHGLDFLQTDGPGLPIRQRSMRAVFDQSWYLLAAREQQVLARLAVFRGSFTREGALQVAGASLQELRALMDRSLLQGAAAGRYEMHDLLRQYVEEKLAEAPGAAQDACDRHSAYYAAALERWWVDLQGRKHQAALAEMGAESGNLPAAWDWAVQRGQDAQLNRAMEGLCYFYKWSGRYGEGESLCRRAAEGLAGTGDFRGEGRSDPSMSAPAAEPAEQNLVLARARAWQGVFCQRLGRPEQARGLMDRSLAGLDGLDSDGLDPAGSLPEEIQRGRAFVLWRLGNLTSEKDSGAAKQYYGRSLAIYRALKDPWATASALEALGRTATFSGESDLALKAYDESLKLLQAQGDDLGTYRVLSLSLATRAYRGQAQGQPLKSQMNMQSVLQEVVLAMGAGQFAKAESLLAQRQSTSDSPGAGGSANSLELLSVFNELHLGHYGRARSLTMSCLDRFRKTGYRWGIERSCFYLACATLATGSHEEARSWLQESIDLCRELSQRGHLGQSLGLMAIVARASGSLSQVRQYLREALRAGAPVRDYETFMFQMIVVLAMALLLCDEGEGQRGVDLYTLVSRYPLVAKSRLAEDLVGRHIATVADQLPPGAAAVTSTRESAPDLGMLMAGFEAELGEWMPDHPLAA